MKGAYLSICITERCMPDNISTIIYLRTNIVIDVISNLDYWATITVMEYLSVVTGIGIPNNRTFVVYLRIKVMIIVV